MIKGNALFFFFIMNETVFREILGWVRIVGGSGFVL